MATTYQAPFTAHIKIIPKRGTGKRFEIHRELQRLAVFAHDSLSEATGITIASPGGGQARNIEKFSDHADGLAVKPQFGETPAQMTVVGFYEVTDQNVSPHPETQLIHAGEAVSGAYGAHAWQSGGNPTSTTATQVKALKALIEASLNADMPDDAVFSVFRIEYKGIVWGDRGHHFPR